jgi:hypothetical protein
LRVVKALHRSDASRRQIALMTRIGSIGDNGSGGYHAYRCQGGANAAGMSLARSAPADRGGDPAPGYVRTGMTEGNIDPADAAKQLVERIGQLNIGRPAYVLA